VDDILIATPFVESMIGTVRQHERDVKRVLKELEKHKLVADDKIEWFVQEVQFCGHLLGYGKRRPEPGKLRALQGLEPLKTVTALEDSLDF